MEVKALIKNAIITPRKARMVIELIRGKTAEEADTILAFTPRKGARIVRKLVKSAVSNAVNNFGLEKGNLFVKTVEATDGMVMKRWLPRAHGHATPILKRRSHIKITLGEIKGDNKPASGKKTEIKTLTYEEVKKAIEEAKKASKGMDAKKTKTEGESKPTKDLSKGKGTGIGDTFKKLVHRSGKKG